jgi:reactive intermediate/imine deaminase
MSMAGAARMLESCLFATDEAPNMTKHPISSTDAPAALGPYSQAIRVGDTVYLSGQLGLDPVTGILVEGIEAQTQQVFLNLRAVAAAAGGSLDDMVKLSILMQDLGDFAKVNEIMSSYFKQPYPARATYQVAALPRAALIEIEGILVLTPSGGK